MRAWSHDRLARAPSGSRSEARGRGHPALLPSGYLLAALALLLMAPPALAGWLAGAVVVRFGWVSPGAPGSGGQASPGLALLVIGPARATGGLAADVQALGNVPIPPGSSWAVLETIAAVLWRGIGMAAVTVPAGVLAAVLDSNPGGGRVTAPD